jgi:very-short-patch-repair endonuclease
MNAGYLPMFYGASGKTFEKSRALRLRMTDAEKMLWNHISKKQRKGYRFRRQHPVGHFIADFYCHEAVLAIEVDGGIHRTKSQSEHDEQRDGLFKNWGIKVLRFDNDEIFYSIESVLQRIDKVLPDR